MEIETQLSAAARQSLAQAMRIRENFTGRATLCGAGLGYSLLDWGPAGDHVPRDFIRKREFVRHQ